RPAQPVHQLQQVAGEVQGSVGGRLGPLALAVAALVERKHVEPVGKGGRHLVEPVRVGRAAVKEAEGRRAGPARFQEVQAQPANPSAGKAGGRPVGALVTPSAEAPGPSPLASIPDTMRAPERPRPCGTGVAIARPPAVEPRPRPEARPTPRPAKPEPAVEFPW